MTIADRKLLPMWQNGIESPDRVEVTHRVRDMHDAAAYYSAALGTDPHRLTFTEAVLAVDSPRLRVTLVPHAVGVADRYFLRLDYAGTDAMNVAVHRVIRAQRSAKSDAPVHRFSYGKTLWISGPGGGLGRMCATLTGTEGTEEQTSYDAVGLLLGSRSADRQRCA